MSEEKDQKLFGEELRKVRSWISPSRNDFYEKLKDWDSHVPFSKATYINREQGNFEPPSEDLIYLLKFFHYTLPFRFSVAQAQKLWSLGIGGEISQNILKEIFGNIGDPPNTKPQPEANSRLVPLPAQCLGREKDLNNLKAQLGVPTRPIPGLNNKPPILQNRVTLLGLPGVGKSTLCAVLANDLDVQNSFPDGVFWVALGQNPNISQELGAWGKALGLNDLDSLEIKSARDILLKEFKNKKCLLIIDDIWNSQHLKPFCVGGGKSRYLFTTRSPLVAKGIFTSSLGLYRLEGLDNEAGIKVLQELAPEVVKSRAEASKQLVEALGGLPLALQVAGRLLNFETNDRFDIQQLLKDIYEGPKLLRAEVPFNEVDNPDIFEETTPTVLALLEKSTEKLSSKVRKCFASLGFFAAKPARMTFDEMKKVWTGFDHDNWEAIRVLTSRGLLEETEDGMYCLHSLLGGHALQIYDQEIGKKTVATESSHSQTPPPASVSQKKHARIFLEEAFSAEEMFRSGDSSRQTGLLLFDRIWPNMIKAWRGLQKTAPAADRDKFLMEFAMAAPTISRLRFDLRRNNGQFRFDLQLEYLPGLRQAIQIAHENKKFLKQEFILLKSLGIVYVTVGPKPKAIETFLDQKKVADKLGIPVFKAEALRNIGNGYLANENILAALPYYEDALRIALEIADPLQIGLTASNMGLIKNETGDYDGAISNFNLLLKYAQENEDPIAEAEAASNISLAYIYSNRPAEGLIFGECALAISIRLKNEPGIAQDKGVIAEALLRLGRAEEAVFLIQESLKILDEDRIWKAQLLNALGLAYMALNEFDKAKTSFEQCIETAGENSSGSTFAKARWNLGEVFEKMGDLPQAIKNMEFCIEYEKGIGHSNLEKHLKYVANLIALLKSRG